MKFNQQSVRRSSLGKTIAFALSAAAMLALAGRAGATVVLEDDFEHDSGSLVVNDPVGTSYTSATDTFSYHPEVGSATTLYPFDDATIGSGLGSSPNGLHYVDNHPGQYAISYTPGGPATHSMAHLQFDYLFHAAGDGLITGNPILGLNLSSSGLGNAFFNLSYYPSGTFYAGYRSNGSPSLSSPITAADTEYHFDFAFNLSSDSVVFTVSHGLSLLYTSPVIGFGTGGNAFNPLTGIALVEFQSGNTAFATSYGNGSYGVLDNVVLEVIPEPSTILLLGIGAGLLWLRRQLGRRSA